MAPEITTAPQTAIAAVATGDPSSTPGPIHRVSQQITRTTPAHEASSTTYFLLACSRNSLPRECPHRQSRTAKAKLDAADACSTKASGDDFLSVDYHLQKNSSLLPWAKDYTYECQITIRPQADFVGPKTDLVLMSMGGNDLGFSHLVTNCFGPRIPMIQHRADATKCRDDIASAKSNLTTVVNHLKSQISELLTKRMTGSNTSQVVLMAYPLLSSDRAYVLNNDGVSYDASRGIRELGEAAISEQRQAVSELEKTFPGRVKFHRGDGEDIRQATSRSSRAIQE